VTTDEFRNFCFGGWAALMLFAAAAGLAALAIESIHPDSRLGPGLVAAGIFACAAALGVVQATPKKNKESQHP
jgi:hypothetical protein